MDYAADGVVSGGVGAFGFDLGAGGEGDEGVAGMLAVGLGKGGGASRQGHGQEAAARAGKGMGNVVPLLSGGRSRHSGLVGGCRCCHARVCPISGGGGMADYVQGGILE